MTDQIFISYSKKDSDFARKLADDLEAADFKIWIDKSIGGGDLWRETIEKNLKAASEVIIVVSPNSMASEWVKHEGSLAYGWGKRLFPVLIESVESLPPWLEEYQWIDFVTTPRKIAFEALVAALTPPNPIQDLLDYQVAICQETKELLSDGVLKLVEENRETLIISPEVEDLIARSARSIEDEHKNELERTRLLAESQRKRAEAEQKRAEEQQEAADKLRKSEGELRNSEAKLRRFVKYLIGALVGVAIVGVIAVVFGLMASKTAKENDALANTNATVAAKNEQIARTAQADKSTAQAASTQAIAQEANARANEAEAKRQEEIALSRQYATLAWYFMDDRYDLSALFSVESIGITLTNEAQTVLETGVQQHANIRYLPGPINHITLMNFSKDGELFAAASCKGNRDTVTPFCQESNIWLWEIPSRQLVGLPFSVPGEVNRLLITSGGKTLIAGICSEQSTAHYCNHEVWIWDLLSYRLTHASLVVSERYPLYMDVSSNNILAIASCQKQQEIDEGFRCLQSEVHFFNIETGQFVYQIALFDEVLGPVAFTGDDFLVVSRCTTMNEIGTGCFVSEISIMDVRTSETVNGPYRLGIDYPLDILPSDYDRIYISTCHESEDLGLCAQPRIWRWDVDYDKPVSYWSPDILPVSLSMFDYELLVLSPNAIEARNLEEERTYYLLNLTSSYSGLTFNPEISTAAAFHDQGEIVLFYQGWDNIFGDLAVTESTEAQDLIKGACEIAGRNFTQAEWKQYFPGEEYRVTCPQWPAGE